MPADSGVSCRFPKSCFGRGSKAPASAFAASTPSVPMCWISIILLASSRSRSTAQHMILAIDQIVMKCGRDG
jgi:hypothetical protein